MSTIILSETLNKTSIQYSKIISVDTKCESLGDYVKRKRDELKLSLTDVEKRSRAGGAKGISNGYISQIENDPTVNPSGVMLKALAKGLGVPEYEIARVAGFELNPADQSELREIYGQFSGYEDLTEEDKEELKPMLVMLANDIRRRLSKRK